MKKHLSLLAFLCLCGVLAFAQRPAKCRLSTTDIPTYNLADALAQKLISLTIQGNGGYQQGSLKLICRNLQAKHLRVRIPQGQLFEPADTTLQTLVVSESRTALVPLKSPAEIPLNTFCTQAGDRSPVAGAAFAVGALAPASLCSLLKFISEKGKEGGVAQAAVWCITSGNSLAGIGDAELTVFTAQLLGKAAPGYRISYEERAIRPGDRATRGKALVIEGNYQYYLDKPEKLVMWLLDGVGKRIKQLSKVEPMVAGEHRGSLRLEVYNLPPGKYVVRMQTVKGEVIKDTEVEF